MDDYGLDHYHYYCYSIIVICIVILLSLRGAVRYVVRYGMWYVAVCVAYRRVAQQNRDDQL